MPLKRRGKTQSVSEVAQVARLLKRCACYVITVIGKVTFQHLRLTLESLVLFLLLGQK